MKNIGTVIILLLIFCSYYGKGWEIRWNHISRRAKYSLLGIAIAANDFGISSSNSNHENVFFPTIGVVHADSTGKVKVLYYQVLFSLLTMIFSKFRSLAQSLLQENVTCQEFKKIIKFYRNLTLQIMKMLVILQLKNCQNQNVQ